MDAYKLYNNGAMAYVKPNGHKFNRREIMSLINATTTDTLMVASHLQNPDFIIFFDMLARQKGMELNKDAGELTGVEIYGSVVVCNVLKYNVPSADSCES